jgi:hypothetical protein
VLGLPPPPVEQRLGRHAAVALDHAGRALVDVGARRQALDELGQTVVEPAVRAGLGHDVGLHEVQDHVGHVPALTGRRAGPSGLVEGLEEGGELSLLGLQGIDDRVHGPTLPGRRRPCPQVTGWGTARDRAAASSERARVRALRIVPRP